MVAKEPVKNATSNEMVLTLHIGLEQSRTKIRDDYSESPGSAFWWSVKDFTWEGRDPLEL